MKTIIHICIVLLGLGGQTLAQSGERIAAIRQTLDSLSCGIGGLEEQTTLSLRNVPLSEYVRAIGVRHRVNVYIEDTPAQIMTSNLVNEPVKSVFAFVCERFNYELQISGSILQFLPWKPPTEGKLNDPKPVKISYTDGKLSLDLRNDSLLAVIRKVSELTGRKIITKPGTEGMLSLFLPPTDVDTALEALFIANGFSFQPRRKGYYVLQAIERFQPADEPARPQGGTDFMVEAFADADFDYISIEARNADLQALVEQIFAETGVDYLLYEQLSGVITMNADMTRLEDALRYLFQGTAYTYKKDESLYLIGAKDLEGMRSTRIVKMKYRPTFQAIDLIPGVEGSESSSLSQEGNSSSLRQNPEFRNNQSTFSDPRFSGNTSFQQNNSYVSTDASIPPEILRTRAGEVEIIEYPELNRIILRGPTDRVDEVAFFLEEIDQPVPMVKVEMVVVEVNKERLLSTGVNAGLRQAGDSTGGNQDVLPGIDYTLNGAAINTILGGSPVLSNLGMLRSNFYLQLRAQETRGNVKVRMQPVLSMLNGRAASLVIGQTQYYLLETQTASNGAVNNFQQFTQRFERIEANVSLSIKPYISEDDMVTLEILPDFTTPVGAFDSQVPPTIATRRFDSIIRVKNGETVILGGLSEEETRDNSRGVPLLSRIPILRRLFGSVDTGKATSSLIIYITPVIYYQ
ncbi:MAG: type II and III secretion system protein [Bacteroidota bacterium]